MSKTEILRELVARHAPAEVTSKLRAIESLEAKLNDLKAERRRALHDLISPDKTTEPHSAARNGVAVPF